MTIEELKQIIEAKAGEAGTDFRPHSVHEEAAIKYGKWLAYVEIIKLLTPRITTSLLK